MKDGVITNENRINAALPTIQKLVNDGAKVILCSHLGKPKNGPEAKFSLAPVAVALSAKLGKTVVFADDDNVVGENAKAAVAAMNNGDVVLLQNTRFRKEETKNLPEFSQDLASLADAYVDDAFGSCHRAHCSTAGVTDYIKDTAVGYLMEKEIKYLGNAVNDPVRPFTAILGGAKVADKLNVISNLLEKVDTLIIGGGMAYTFIKAQGYEVGKSLCDDSKLDYCKEMMAKAQEKGVKLLLPVDTACVENFPDPIDAPVETTVVPVTAIPADMEGCDIGPETMKLFADAVKASKTVVWNGPMGVFEFENFAAGTRAMAQALADSGAVTLADSAGETALLAAPGDSADVAGVHAQRSGEILSQDLGYSDVLRFAVMKNELGYVGLNGYIQPLEQSAFPELSEYYGAFTGRGYIWLNTLPALKNCFLIGTGTGEFCFHYPQNDIVGALNTHGSANLLTDKPHSMYLGLAVSCGIPALLIFLALAVITLRRGAVSSVRC